MKVREDNLIPSDQRVLPFRRRLDLVLREASGGMASEYVLQDPVAGSYWRLTPEQFCVLECLRERISLRELRDQLAKRFPQRNPSMSEVRLLVTSLAERRLLQSVRSGAAAGNHPPLSIALLRRVLQCLLFCRLPGFHPARFLTLFERPVRWLMTPAMLSVTGVLLLAGWGILLGDLEILVTEVSTASQYFSLQSLLLVWLMIGLSKIIHEMAHGLMCRYFGRDCTEMGVAFLLCSPCLYCDVSDAWMLPRKSGRILIALAGPTAEVVVGTVSLLLWKFTSTGLLNQACLQLGVVSLVSSLLLNLNPLLRYDGYYILSDWLEIPNLRTRGDRAVGMAVRRLLSGEPTQRSDDQTGWLAILLPAYAIAAWIYRWMLIVAIGVMLGQLLEPTGLSAAGVVFVGLQAIGSLTWTTQYLTKIFVSTADRTASSRRPVLIVSTLLLVLAWGLCQPILTHGTAACLLEPAGIRHVYAEVSGRLEHPLVKVGELVQQGAPLFQLGSAEVDQEITLHEAEVRQLETEIRLLSLTSDAQSRVITEVALQLARLRHQQSLDALIDLTLRAPAGGRVVAVDPVENMRMSEHLVSDRPESPLSISGSGSHVLRGTHLCSIDSGTGWRAVLYVNDDLKAALAVDHPVEIRCDACPGTTITGCVERIAREGTRDVPDVLLDRWGGSIGSTVLESGSVAASSSYFRVDVRLHSSELQVISGLRGRARFVSRERSILGWLQQQWSGLASFQLTSDWRSTGGSSEQ